MHPHARVSQIYCNEAGASPHRFWLAACLETFARGSHPANQLLLYARGLLQHLARSLSRPANAVTSTTLQVSFDLLGEAIKNFPALLGRLGHLLLEDEDGTPAAPRPIISSDVGLGSAPPDTFDAFVANALDNLVASNVFLRSALLTMERLALQRLAARGLLESWFEAGARAEWSDETLAALPSTPLLGALSEEVTAACGSLAVFLDRQWYSVLRSLMDVIGPEDINQEK